MLMQVSNNADEPKQWFAVQVKCRYERFIATILSQKGFESFAPVYPKSSSVRAPKQPAEAPLFPGYVFARFDVLRRLPILTTPGVYAIVGHGKTPAAIPDSEISAIESAVAANMNVEPCPFLTIGSRVLIVKGLMINREGILIESRSGCHVVLSVSTIERSVRVHVHRDDVTLIEDLRAPMPRVDSRPVQFV